MDDLFTLFTARLDAVGVEYMVTGGVASIVYGEPRLTHDIDIVVSLESETIPVLLGTFAVAEFYAPPVDAIRVELSRPGGQFTIIHHETGFRADVVLAGRDALHRWAFAHRLAIPFGSTTLQIAPAEYVILRKLERYREHGGEKHIQDICGMLRHSPDAVDAEQLGRMIAERRLTQEWAIVEGSSTGE